MRFSQKSCHMALGVSHDINSTCAGKPWPWRIEWWVKLWNPTLWGRHGGFWSPKIAKNLKSWPIELTWKSQICSGFHKTVAIASCVCRRILIRRALESPDPGASNGGSNVVIRHSGADMVALEVAGWPRISNLSKEITWLRFEILGHQATSKATTSAPKCRISTFDPPFDAPGSGLSSALRINIVRHTCDRMAHFLWTLDKNCHFADVWNVTCLDMIKCFWSKFAVHWHSKTLVVEV